MDFAGCYNAFKSAATTAKANWARFDGPLGRSD